MLKKEKLETYKKKLLGMREQILNRGRVTRAEGLTIDREDLVDESDHAAMIIQQSVSLNVQARDRFLLQEIEHALSKFEESTYGLCEDTEEPIDEGRLDAQPWTRYCVEAQEERERLAKRFARAG
ncbi:MAG: TraR/DksA family transcriptional regulator [Bdellovibrionota bacterium]